MPFVAITRLRVHSWRHLPDVSCASAAVGSFRLFLHGKKEADLRFLLVPHGALPMLPAAEEVALLDADPGGERDGVWYLSHRQEEVSRSTGSSSEDHRLAVAQHYQIDNTIANNAQLSAKATVQFSSNADGLRVVALRFTHGLSFDQMKTRGR